jgi:hypothetical protein
MRFHCLIFVALMALLPSGLIAQEEDPTAAGGGYGYTVVNYDPSSNTVTIYAETDDDDESYYSPAVDTAVFNNEGYLFTSGDSSSPCPGGTQASDGADGDVASVTCTINNPNQNDVYTANSVHSLVAYVSDYDEGEQDNDYYDIDGYDSFASLDMSAPFGDYYDPPYLLQHPKTQRIPLGKTTDSDSTGAKAACGDVRDQIIAEYVSKTTPTTFTMIDCSDFQAAATYLNSDFTFLELAPTQTTGYNQFAVIQGYMTDYLGDVFTDLGDSPSITSGYRNPAKEATVGTYYPNSRHMAGDAVDLDTGASSTVYAQQRTAGLDNSACVEPVDVNKGPQKDYNHTHLDWRTEATPNGASHFAGPISCPPKWGN